LDAPIRSPLRTEEKKKFLNGTKKQGGAAPGDHLINKNHGGDIGQGGHSSQWSKGGGGSYPNGAEKGNGTGFKKRYSYSAHGGIWLPRVATTWTGSPLLNKKLRLSQLPKTNNLYGADNPTPSC